MAGKENKNSNVNRARGKKLKYCNDDECQRWSDLPMELLYLILMQVTFVDFFAFGGVCKSWRVVASTNRQHFMERQSPLIVALSRHAKRTVLLSNVFEGSIFKTVLPNFSGRTFYGVSCGYLVLKDSRSIAGLWLLNPVTRQEYRLSNPHYLASRVIVASSTLDASDIAIVALSGSPCQTSLSENRRGNLEIYWPRNEHSVLLHGTHDILDLAIFQGKVYVLTDQGSFGILNLRPHPVFALQEVKVPRIDGIVTMPNLRLVASDTQLFLVLFYRVRKFKVYKLDFERMEWLEVDSLGDQALFVSHPMSIELIDATRWGEQNNCIYYLEYDTYICTCYSLDGRNLKSFQIVGTKNISNLAMPLWYFPNLSCSTSSLSEDYF